MYLLFMFLYIFNFRLIKTTSLSSTVIVVAILLCLCLLINKQYLNCYKRYLLSRYNIGIILWGSLTILVMLLVTIIQDIFDLELVRLMCNQIFIIEVGIMLVAFYDFKNKLSQIIDILIDAFIIQSIIQIFSIVSESFRELTNIFRDDMVIYYSMRDYAGSRGVAISGAAFFGLAVAYGIIFIIIVYHWNHWKYNSLAARIALLTLLFIGAMSAGRTAIIGFGIAVFYFCIANLKKVSLHTKTKNILCFFCVLLGTVLAGCFFLSQKNEYSIKIFMEYSLEFIDNFISGRGLTSSSTNNLFHGMYFPLSLKQYLIGDGQYMDGSLYYMHTDAGYMRMVLYFGIGGFILLCIYQMQLLKLSNKTSKEKILLSFIFITLLIFQIKGDVIGLLQILQAILIVLHAGINSKYDLNINKKMVCRR